MEKEKKKILNTKSLFNNSKFMLLVSFILACFFWVVFASSSGEESTLTITDVPVTIELSEQAKKDGLKVYRGGDTKVTVQIRGNRMTIGSLSKDDIQVVAQNTGSINFANTYALSLSAKKTGVKSDYEIISVSPSVINVIVDKERSQTFTIEKNINTSGVTLPVSDNNSDSGYYLAKPVISSDTAVVTGPEQEVKKIAKLQVYDRISGEYHENITKLLEVQPIDSDGEFIDNDLISISPQKVDTTIRILPKKEVPVTLQFLNVPSGIDTDRIASVKPSSVTLAGTSNILGIVSEIKLDPVDFNTLDPSKTQITSNISIPTGCINISNEEQAKISFKFSDYSSKVITVSNFNLIEVPAGYKATVSTSSINVSVAGPTDVISGITSSDIEANVDLSSLADGFEGSQELPVNIDLSSLSRCWCFNEYTVTVSVSKE